MTSFVRLKSGRYGESDDTRRQSVSPDLSSGQLSLPEADPIQTSPYVAPTARDKRKASPDDSDSDEPVHKHRDALSSSAPSSQAGSTGNQSAIFIWSSPTAFECPYSFHWLSSAMFEDEGQEAVSKGDAIVRKTLARKELVSVSRRQARGVLTDSIWLVLVWLHFLKRTSFWCPSNAASIGGATTSVERSNRFLHGLLGG